jgi:hypothetical protein
VKGRGLIWGVAVLVLVLAVAGCRTTKPSITGKEYSSDWHNVVLPMKVVIQGNAGITASGRMTMVRDESVYGSVRMLGMELFSVFAAGDSIWAYDKMSGTLLSERLGNDPTTGRRLDIGRLQDLLLGVNGVPSEFAVDAWKFRIVFEAADTLSTPYGLMRVGWNADVEGADMEEEVRWNFEEARWNSEKVGTWKYPRSPKRIISGSGELLKWLGLNE